MSDAPADEKAVAVADATAEERQSGSEAPNEASAAVAAPSTDGGVEAAAAADGASPAVTPKPVMKPKRAGPVGVPLAQSVAVWHEMLTCEAQFQDELERRRRVVLARHDPIACLKMLEGTSKLLADDFYRAIARHRRVEAAILVQAIWRTRGSPGGHGTFFLPMLRRRFRQRLADALDWLLKARDTVHQEAVTVFERAATPLAARISALRKSMDRSDYQTMKQNNGRMPKDPTHPAYRMIKKAFLELVEKERTLSHLEELMVAAFEHDIEIEKARGR